MQVLCQADFAAFAHVRNSSQQWRTRHYRRLCCWVRGNEEGGKKVTFAQAVCRYKWIKDHTPKDSRVLSWWDYGYQIAGIANRTTLADGNTWNLEHIALIGKILTSSQPEVDKKKKDSFSWSHALCFFVCKAHKLARHLADYVLVWAGGGGDDLAKVFFSSFFFFNFSFFFAL